MANSNMQIAMVAMTWRTTDALPAEWKPVSAVKARIILAEKPVAFFSQFDGRESRGEGMGTRAAFLKYSYLGMVAEGWWFQHCNGKHAVVVRKTEAEAMPACLHACVCSVDFMYALCRGGKSLDVCNCDAAMHDA